MVLPFMMAAAKAAGSFSAWVSGTGAVAASHIADPALEGAAAGDTMALADVVGRVGVAIAAFMAAGGLAVTAGDMACSNGHTSGAKEGREQLETRDLRWNGPVLQGAGPQAGGIAPQVGVIPATRSPNRSPEEIAADAAAQQQGPVQVAPKAAAAGQTQQRRVAQQGGQQPPQQQQQPPRQQNQQPPPRRQQQEQPPPRQQQQQPPSRQQQGAVPRSSGSAPPQQQQQQQRQQRPAAAAGPSSARPAAQSARVPSSADPRGSLQTQSGSGRYAAPAAAADPRAAGRYPSAGHSSQQGASTAESMAAQSGTAPLRPRTTSQRVPVRG